jgi:hypothetical protein
LKQLRFDEPCFGYYHLNEGYTKGYAFCYFNEPKIYESDSAVLAPTFSQAFRWFREKHGLVGIIKFGTNDFTYNIYNVDGIGLLTKESLNFNGTYQEAELACLQKLIEIVKNK